MSLKNTFTSTENWFERDLVFFDVINGKPLLTLLLATTEAIMGESDSHLADFLGVFRAI